MTGTDTGMAPPLFADYFDGHSAVPRRVEVHVLPDRLELILPEGDTLDWWFDGLRRLPDQAATKGITVALAARGNARLVLPDAASDLADELRDRLPERAPPSPVPGVRAKLLGLSTAAIASVAFILLVLVPLLADQLATFLPVEGEKALGDTTFEQIRVALDDRGDGLRICDRAAGEEALERMTRRLAKHAEFPFPLQVHVLDHPLINAFALPGGHIVLFEGLLEAANDPDEVAAVLAHEMGHVAGRDATRGALRSAGSIGILGLVFGDFAGGTAALFLAEQLVSAQYSQEVELRADAWARQVMVAAQIDPGALARFFETLEAEYGDAPEILAHFSTHPEFSERIAETSRVAAPVQTSPSLSDSDWRALRDICG